MKRTWIKNARIVNEGKIFHGSIVIENEVIAEVLAEETVPSPALWRNNRCERLLSDAGSNRRSCTLP